MHSFQYAPDYTLIYMEPFIHLHVHTQYSLLDGQASIDALIDKANKDGMRAIAVTDHGVMFRYPLLFLIGWSILGQQRF